MPNVVNAPRLLVALTALCAPILAEAPARADVIRADGTTSGRIAVEPRGCGGDAYSYGIVRERRTTSGRFAIGSQTLCAELERHESLPLGPIGIIVEPEPNRGRPAPALPRGRR